MEYCTAIKKNKVDESVLIQKYEACIEWVRYIMM